MKKQMLVAFGCSLTLSLCLVTLSWVRSPMVQNTEQIQSVSLYPGMLTTVTGYDVRDNRYTPVNDDPCMLFLLSDMEFNAVSVRFAEAVKQDTAVELYYAVDADGFNESNKSMQVVHAGDDGLQLTIPPGMYSGLRVDVNGEFVLSGVDAEYLRITEARSAFPFDGLNAMCVICFLLVAPIYITLSKT